LDYWGTLKVSYYDGLDEFLSAARPERLYYVSTKARRFYTEISYQWTDYLVFGSETHGLPRELIDSHPENSIKIPMWGAKPRSHNLSNSAAIVLYEALRQVKGF
jgi:tRNA (cytidine/uridine-2'-O-)-methyltransferase